MSHSCISHPDIIIGMALGIMLMFSVFGMVFVMHLADIWFRSKK